MSSTSEIKTFSGIMPMGYPNYIVSVLYTFISQPYNFS